MTTTHPARRLRHGERPTEPLVFEDAAANKAAEEGGLPDKDAWAEVVSEVADLYARLLTEKQAVHALRGMDRGTQYYVADAIRWSVAELQNRMWAIAADRASRQVANKAEVEPIYQVRRKMENSFSTPFAWHDVSQGDYASTSEDFNEKRIVYATPPATTGASTAPVIAWAHEDGRVVAAPTMESAQRDGGAMKSSLAGYTIPLGEIGMPSPASIVLTDERIAELLALVGPTAGIYDDSYDLSIAKIQKLMRLAQREPSDQSPDIANAMFALDCAVNALEYMRSERDAAIAREVAAQAGQVAVPDDVARDAARYQFLRHADLDELARMYWPESEVPEGIELDEAIDAAMTAAPSPAKESK